MDPQAPRTLLERIIREGDHTLDEVCGQFNEAAENLSEPATISVRQLQRWMSAESSNARPASRRVAAHLWNQSFDVLLGPPSTDAESQAVAVRPFMHSDHKDGKLGENWEDLVVATAHESTSHAAHAGGAVDGVSIEQLQAEAWRLARSYATTAPLTVLAAARQARDLTYFLLERTRRPVQTNDLYLVAAQLCGLMAIASFDLGALDASLAQARATSTYGDLVGDRSVTAWARGHQALISYWTGDPRAALDLAHTGLADAPTGTASTRLHCITARSWAHIGDPSMTREALAAADHAQEGSLERDFLHDKIGGSFGWGPSRHAACAGSALLRVGETTDAINRIQLALRLLPADQQGGLLAERAQCDLATAEILGADIDAASGTLAPVWGVPAERRRHGITGRLLWIERVLASRPWRGNHQAADIREQIIMFNAAASARALPPAAGDPTIPGGE